jgi:hypothetical protein
VTESATGASAEKGDLQCFAVERQGDRLSASEPIADPEPSAAETCCGSFACHATVSPEERDHGPAAVASEPFILLNATVLASLDGSGLERPPKSAH